MTRVHADGSAAIAATLGRAPTASGSRARASRVDGLPVC